MITTKRIVEICTAPPPEKSEAWKRENAKYLAWFDSHRSYDQTKADIKNEYSAMQNGLADLGWKALIPAIPLIALVVGVIWAIKH